MTVRTMTCLRGAAVMILLSWVHTSVATEPDDVPDDWRERIARKELLIVVGLTGEPRANSTTRVTWNVEFPELDLLASPLGRQEIEMFDEQIAKIDAIKKEFESARERAWNSFRKGGPPENLYLVNRRFARERDDLRRRLADVLTKQQEQRLQEIAVRWLVRRVGLCQLLLGEWGTKLGLSRDTRLGILREAAVEADRLAEVSAREHRRVIDALLSELEPESRRKVEREMESFVYPASPCIDLLLYQLSYQQGQHRADFVQPYAGFRLSLVFRVGPLGTWVPKKRTHSLGSLGPTLRGLIEHETVTRVLQISEAQRAVFGAISDEYQRKKRELGLRMNRLPPAPTEEALARNKKLFDRIAAEHRQLYADVAELILKALSPKQRAQLEQLSRQCMALRAGYVAALVDGPLGKRVGVTEAEKRRLLRKSKELRTKLVKFTVEQERLAYDVVLDRLPPQQKKKVLQWLGKPIESEPAPISLLIESFKLAVQ